MQRLGILAAFVLATCTGCFGEKERVPSKVILPEVEETAEVAQTPAPSPPADNGTTGETTPIEATPVETDMPPSETASDTPMDPVPDEATGDESTASEAGGLPRLHGRITVTGTPPELPPVAVGAQAMMCNVPSIPSEAVVVGPDGGLANCIIFLKEAPSGAEIPPLPEEPLVVDQKGCQFIPHVTFVRAGQVVDYRNSDTFAHNIRSSPFRNTGINNSAGPGLSLEHTYSQTESRPTPFNCDIHRFMSGYHMILDHPWCAITDENGNFEISGLPEGELEFVAWHEKKGYIERSFKIDIEAGSDVERNFEVAASDLAD